MLAKDANDNAGFLNKRGAWEFLASKLAPTTASQLPHLNGVAHTNPLVLAYH